MELDYLIMHGAGNRILVVDSRERDVEPPPVDELRRLADSTTGPGFDQLMWVTSPHDGGLDAGYRIFNADGSEVQQCGNGVRCVAWMLARETALSRVRSLPDASTESRVAFGEALSRARYQVDGWQTVDERRPQVGAPRSGPTGGLPFHPAPGPRRECRGEAADQRLVERRRADAGDDRGARREQPVRERPQPGADLQDLAARPHVGHGDDAVEDAHGGQEVLAEPLAGASVTAVEHLTGSTPVPEGESPRRP